MSTVVLGGNGYLGSAIAGALSKTSEVRAVSLHQHAPREGIDQVVADLTDPTRFPIVLDGARTIVLAVGHRSPVAQWRVTDDHAAALRINVGVVEHVIDTLVRTRAVSRPPLILFASSMAVHHDSAPTGYAQHKRVAEALLSKAAQQGIARVVSLRLSTVYGTSPQHQTGGGFVASWARAALSGKDLQIWGDGSVLRDLIHVDDAARAFAMVDGSNTAAYSSYDVGSGAGSSLAWIAEQVVSAASSHTSIHGRVVSVPRPQHATMSDAADIVTDPAPLAAEHGWVPRISAQNGIDSLIRTLAAERSERER